MSAQDVRAGIQQAKVGDSGIGFVTFEAIAFAIGIGVWKSSWAVGIVALVAVFFAVPVIGQFKFLSKLLAGAIGLAWGVAAMVVATIFGAPPPAAVAAMALAFVIGAGANSAAFQAVRDVQAAKG